MSIEKCISVYAGDFPEDVENFCIENEISTHYSPGRHICDPYKDTDPLTLWVLNHAKENNLDLSPYIKKYSSFSQLVIWIQPT